MCGIAGIISLEGRPIDACAIERFTDALAHRGPDGRGVWRDDAQGVALGHRRLAILDLSEAGHQPMSFLQGRYWITFNGEIYNFVELRQELQGRGLQFTSESDTEIILAAYHVWGPSALLRFNGMWAFAIYDREKRELFMARDRFGIKPFLYRLTPKQFAFASELKAFRCLQGYSPSFDQESAIVVLNHTTGLEGTTRTLLSGVLRLQGGYYAVLKEKHLAVTRWWNTLEHLVQAPKDRHVQAEQFRGLFEDSIRLRLRSDVPVGSCLSGGFDSTSVVCTLAALGGSEANSMRQAKDWQHTFVATFPRCQNDERPAAEEVVRYAGVQAHFASIEDRDAVANIDRILFDFDDVYSNLPTAAWQIYRELRRAEIVVSLDGHGADELMGAYRCPDFVLLHEAPSWFRAPRANFQLLRRCAAELTGRSTGDLDARSWLTGLRAEFLNHPDLDALRDLYGAAWQTGRRWLGGHIPFRFRRALATAVPEGFRPVGSDDTLPEHWDRLNRELYGQFHSTTLPTILRNFDRLSMAHGIEIRMPFMDWRLVTFVMSLPSPSKIGGGMTKRVAREAMKSRIPESIRTNTKKIGFNSPLPEWLSGPLREWALDLLKSVNSTNHPLVRTEKIAHQFEIRKRPEDWTWAMCTALWTPLHYLWFEQNFLRHDSSSAAENLGQPRTPTVVSSSVHISEAAL